MTRIENERTQLRTRMVGGLRAEHAGERMELAGWVHRRRNLGGLVFVDLRDRSGMLQVSFGPDWTDAASMETVGDIGHEDVIRVVGTVELRPEGACNEDIETGEIEIKAATIDILADAETPAIPVYRAPEDELPAEELRLRHRVLDLRRRELQEALILRHELILATRNYMDGHGFLEVETPILTKATPEGARDYVVPSRVHKGEFYALPQSPQIYKQILMIAGFDRYFQIARCFRDEDLRSDRQPEFTQIDVEASFVQPEDIFMLMEGLMARLSDVVGDRHVAAVPPPHLGGRDGPVRIGPSRPALQPRDRGLDRCDGLSGLRHHTVGSGSRGPGAWYPLKRWGSPVQEADRGDRSRSEGDRSSRSSVGQVHRGGYLGAVREVLAAGARGRHGLGIRRSRVGRRRLRSRHVAGVGSSPHGSHHGPRTRA